jgi:hypothetical protein
LIQSHFRESLSMDVVELPLDTDLLGTFSGEIERESTPRETAIKKAKLGLQATGLSLGIAPEGSIGPNPSLPWIQSDFELMVFLDAERDLVITETFLSHDIIAASIEISPEDSLELFLEKADFPRHALMAQPVNSFEALIYKGITSLSQLQRAIADCATHSKINKVKLQSDLRAMHSPSRQLNINKAAQLLAERVAALCPACSTPGWGRADYQYGVQCSDCGQENLEIAKVEILGCARCDFTTAGKIINSSVDPGRCNFCNP